METNWWVGLMLIVMLTLIGWQLERIANALEVMNSQ